MDPNHPFFDFYTRPRKPVAKKSVVVQRDWSLRQSIALFQKQRKENEVRNLKIAKTLKWAMVRRKRAELLLEQQRVKDRIRICGFWVRLAHVVLVCKRIKAKTAKLIRERRTNESLKQL